MSIKTSYQWRCDKCGETKVIWSKEEVNELGKEHKCNPRLYKLVNSIKSEFNEDGKITCCDGGVEDVAEYLGITEELASAVLHEMRDRDLANFGRFN
jgi:predicted nucleic acid-binding Zn ribbon protein